MAREDRLVETLVTLADTLVDHYDIIDFLQTLAERCVDLVDVSAAGIMLADPQRELRHAACSNEQMRLVELFELQVEEGPCFDAYRTQAPVVCASPEEAAERWPEFARNAIESGFAAFSAVPMRLRSDVVGALNLFSSDARALGGDDIKVVQAMADIATIGILQERSIRDAHAFSTQLEVALESRVVIEQAKGIVAERQPHQRRRSVRADPRFRARPQSLVERERAPDHRRHASDRRTHRHLVDTTSHPQPVNPATTISSR